MKRVLALGVVVLLLVGTLAGCSGSTNASAAPSTSAAAQSPVTVAFMAASVGSPFYTSIECGARKAAAESNVELNFQGPADWDISKQQPFIDAALQLDPQGLVLSPTDATALVPVVQKLMDKGVPVVTIDGPLAEPVEVQNLQSDHYAGGKAAAEGMIKLTGGKGKYLVLSYRPGLPDHDARTAGFVDAMKAAGADVLPIGYPEADTAKAAQITTSTIQGNPDLAGVYATAADAAAGASAAIRGAGLQGKVRLVAFDADPQQVVDLKAGVFDALVAQAPYMMGLESVKLIAQLIRKEVDQKTVAHNVGTPFFVLTKDNVDSPEAATWVYVPDLSRCP